MLEDMDVGHSETPYHSNIWWVSLGEALNSVWDLEEERLMFLSMKERD
jgi:hypothetical protein